jgi:mannose/fructose/N-acetylgalactosamine-specific phosphotransferase system component IIC
MACAAGCLSAIPLAAAMVAPGDPGWLALLLLGALGGLLLLDDTALAQTWFSQPLPVAVLTGAFCGDPLTGLALGLPIQLILAGNLPVGQSFIGDPVPPMVAVVGAAVLAGDGLQPTLGAAMGAWQGLIGSRPGAWSSRSCVVP